MIAALKATRSVSHRSSAPRHARVPQFPNRLNGASHTRDHKAAMGDRGAASTARRRITRPR